MFTVGTMGLATVGMEGIVDAVRNYLTDSDDLDEQQQKDLTWLVAPWDRTQQLGMLNFKKGEIMLIDDHINLQGGSPLAFKGVEKLGERFVDLNQPYDAKMNAKIEEIAAAHNINLHKGVYASVVGPQLETRAEYRYLKIIGADAVGMSTVPEIIVANHLQIPVIALSVLTDECDPDNLKPVDITDIIAQAGKAEPAMITLFTELIQSL